MMTTMEMCSGRTDSDYSPDVMCAEWNPEIAALQDRAAELAVQLIHFQARRASGALHGMPADVAGMEINAFLRRMYASQR